MPSINPIQDPEQERIDAQIALAEALRRQGMAGDGGARMVGNLFVKGNQWGNLAQVLGGAITGGVAQSANEALGAKRDAERQAWLGQMPSPTETQRYDPVSNPGTGPLVEGMEVPKDPRALAQATQAWAMKAPRGTEGVQKFALQQAMTAPQRQAEMEARMREHQLTLAMQAEEREKDRIEKGEQAAADRVNRAEMRAMPTIRISTRGGGSSADGDAVNQDAADLIAGRFINGDKSALIGISRNKALHSAVMTSIARQSKEQGLDAKDLVQFGLEYTGASAEQKTIGNQAANVAMAANEANQMIDVATDLSKKIPRTEFPTINAAGNIIRKQSGDPNVVAFNQAIDSLVNGYARAINPKGVATVADKKRAHETLNAAFSSGQFDSTVAVMRREMNAALNAPVEARKGAREARLGTGGGHSVEKTVVREVKLKDGRTGVEYSDGSRGFK